MITKIAKTSVLIRLTGLIIAGFLLLGTALPAQVGAVDETKASDTSTGTSKSKNVTDPAAKKDNPGICTKEACPLISRYVNPAIATLSVLVGIVAVLAIVVGGIQVTTSAGDPQKSAAGKNHIRNALIGIVAYLFLYAFLQWLIPGGLI